MAGIPSQATGTAKGAGGKLNLLGNLTSPEGLIINLIAFMADIVPDICDDIGDFAVGIGIIVAIILDTLAAIFFAFWMFFTSKNAWRALLLAWVIQIVPYIDLGGMAVGVGAMFFNVPLCLDWISFVNYAMAKATEDENAATAVYTHPELRK